MWKDEMCSILAELGKYCLCDCKVSGFFVKIINHPRDTCTLRRYQRSCDVIGPDYCGNVGSCSTLGWCECASVASTVYFNVIFFNR